MPSRSPSPSLTKLLGICSLLGLLSTGASAQWSFIKVADGDTAIPGGQGATFDVFSAPALSGDRVAFYGRSGDFHSATQVGIFAFENGSLRIVADHSTPVPQGTALFTRFNAASISASQVSFWGQNHYFPLHEGIYTDTGGVLRVVADVNTPIPGGMGAFGPAFLISQSTDSGNTALIHSGFSGQGVYVEIAEDLHVVADLSTLIPGGQGTFAPPSGSTAFDEVSLSGQAVAFVGRGAGQEGIYSTLGGALRAEFDLNSAVPGSSETFGCFRGPSLDGGDLAFYASSLGPIFGIYARIAGQLRVVADTNTAIPRQPLNFSLFEPFTSLDDGNVVLWGRGGSGSNLHWGIFALYRGALVKVIDNTDTLDGRSIRHLTFGPDALSGDRIAFQVVFPDFSQGIYIAVAAPPFRDGFETGDTSAWSSTVPGPGS